MTNPGSFPKIPAWVMAAVSPLSIARMLWNRKLLIVVLWAGFSAAGMGLVRRIPDVYRAQSLILVDSQKIPERFVASTVQVGLEDRLNAIKQQILSASRIQNIIDKFNLYEDERRAGALPEQMIQRMRRDISVTTQRGATDGSGTFEIAYEGHSPAVVAGVVNQISALFIEENLKTREAHAENTSEFLEAQLQQAKRVLEDLESKLSQYKLQRMGELPQQENALHQTLARLQAELRVSEEAISRTQQNKAMLENSLQFAEATEGMLAGALRERRQPLRPSGALAGAATPAEADSAVLQSRLEALRLRYQEEHPEIRRLRRELEFARRREAAQPKPAPAETPRAVETAAAPSPEAVRELNQQRERVASLKLQLRLAEQEIQNHNEERSRILRNIASYQMRLEKLPVREQELTSITRDYEISKQNYTSLLNKKFSAEMATEMERRQQAERFTLVDAARVPARPVRPNRGLLYGASAGAGLLLSLVLGLIAEIKRNCLLGEWELPEDVCVLGRVDSIQMGLPAPERRGSRG